MKKTVIPKTSFLVTIDTEEKTISVDGGPSYFDLKIQFIKKDEVSLDENGDLFEPEYRLSTMCSYTDELSLVSSEHARLFAKNIKEVQTLFEFIEENKRTLFEELKLRGILV